MPRRQSKYSVALADIYEKFPDKHLIKPRQFKLIISTFNSLLMKSIIETGNTYMLPNVMGTLSVRKRKGRGTRRNWRDGTFYKNLHSDGYYARFVWDKVSRRFSVKGYLKRIFKFKPTRTWKRYLSESITNKNFINKYYEHDDS